MAPPQASYVTLCQHGLEEIVQNYQDALMLLQQAPPHGAPQQDAETFREKLEAQLGALSKASGRVDDLIDALPGASRSAEEQYAELAELQTQCTAADADLRKALAEADALREETRRYIDGAADACR